MKQIAKRRTLLPKQPNGYPEMHLNLSESAAVCERWLQAEHDDFETQFLLHDMNSRTQDDRQQEVWKITGIQTWVENGLRTIYPTSEIVEACKHTDAMKGVFGCDIKTTLPSFLLVVPKGQGWISGNGAAITHVLVNIFEDGAMTAKFAKTDAEYTLTFPNNMRTLLLTFYCDDQTCMVMTVPLGEENESIYEVLKVNTDEYHRIGGNNMSKQEQDVDSNVGFEISNFIANVLLIMQSYPEYVTTEEKKMRGLDSKKKNRSVKVSVMATPTNLRQTVDFVPSNNEECSDGKAQDRKTHIRRGHWRRQRHKPNWEIDNGDIPVVIMPDGGHAHMKWILPVVVRTSEDNEINTPKGIAE